MAWKKELTPRQRRAIISLISTRNIEEAALQAKVGARSIHRWLNQPIFRVALFEAESEAVDQATRRLISILDEAIETLSNVLSNEEASFSERIRAAQIVMDYLLKYREMRNLEQRLLVLEETIIRQTISR